MAYIPKDDSQEQSGSTMQVYGSGQQQGESAQDMGSTSTTNTSGMSTSGAAPQGGQSLGPMNKKTPGPKPEARSGMFTNIRKYVKANEPKAQQMGQEVSKDFNKQASEIGNKFQQQQTQFQQQVNQNRQRMQEAEQFGQQQIDQAAGVSAQQPQAQQQKQPSRQDNIKRFQQLTADQAGFGDIGYDVSGQQRKAQDLQNYAESMDREEGLRRGLQATFGAGNQAYTQGMGGLDQMILGANKGVREQMASSAQESAKQLTGDIGQAKTQALRDLSQLELGGTQLAQDLKETLGSRQGDIRQAALDAQSKGVAMKEELSQFLAGEREGISQATADALGISSGQTLYGLNQDNLGSSSIGSFLDQDSRARLSALQDLAGQRDQMLASSQGQEFESQADREARMSGTIEEKTAAFEQESAPVVSNIQYLDKGISDMQAVYAQPDMYTKRMWMNHPLIRPYWDGNEDLSAYNGALSRAMGAASSQRSGAQSNLDSLKRNYFESGPVKINE